MSKKLIISSNFCDDKWNYVCTFACDPCMHTDDTFKKKFINCLKRLSKNKGWKYIGFWDYTSMNCRLHFHGLFYIPEMIGDLKVSKNNGIHTTSSNTYFDKYFGFNSFVEI